MASSNQIPTACGASVGGDLTVKGNMIVHVNNQPASSQGSAVDKSTFRCKLPTPAPHYKGRDSILKEIFEFFIGASTEPTNCWRRMATIVGMGGMGKSETACKFANKFREFFPCAAWIDAETKESTLDSFLSLAKQLGIVSEDRQRGDVELVHKVYQHIDAQYSDKVLLIFDNAIKLRSDENNFGIFDYLPTEDLAHQRFPYVIITSQTPDWQKAMRTFKLEELTEEESINFFRSSLKIPSSECEEAFKKLHRILQGYPLAINLSTSNIDFDSGTDNLDWLQKQIEQYVEKFEKEDSHLLTEKINQNWLSQYSKTLSTVWQLSFQRLKAEPSGSNALMLLQAISFFHVPLNLNHLIDVFIECPFCPGTPDWMKFEYLRDSIRLLKRFHIVDCVFEDLDYSSTLKALQSNNTDGNSEDLSRKFTEDVKSAKSFWCDLKVHRLIQLVVRLQMDCCPVLEDILRYLAASCDNVYVRQLNVPAVEEASSRIRLTTRALSFIGIIALRGNLFAKEIVQITSPPEDPAATIWLVHGLNKDVQTVNSEVIEVLRRLVKLSTFETRLVDKRFFAFMAMQMFEQQRLFPYARDNGTWALGILLHSFTGIEDVAVELLSTCCSFTEACTRPLLCLNDVRLTTARFTLQVGNEMLKHFSKTQLADTSVVEFTQSFEKYREFLDRGQSKMPQYFVERFEIYFSRDSKKKFECEVKSCGTDQLALKQVFSSVLRNIWSTTANKNFTSSQRTKHATRYMDYLVWAFLFYARDLDILLSFMEAIIEVLAHLEKELLDVLLSINENLIWMSSIWVTFSVQEDLLDTDILFSYLARIPYLAQIKKLSADRIRQATQSFSFWRELQIWHETTYQQFIENYSGSSIEEIQTLMTMCREI